MSRSKIKLAIVGVGKIVRDQHLPSIAGNDDFSLVATASRNASVEGVTSFTDIESMLKACDSSELEIDAVALCMPPQFRYAAARSALEHGKHVLLEKPPGATVSEVEQLHNLADQHSVSLYATWHSRHASAVATAKTMLAELELKSAKLIWKEDVKKWHPGQEWIWQAGGLGVFDPGINGISILTECLSQPAFVTQAVLSFPSNKAAPIAAEIKLQTGDGVPINIEFDWRQRGDEAWCIEFHTSTGLLHIDDGGATLSLDDERVPVPTQSEHSEYQAIYGRFAEIIKLSKSEVDLRPLKLVADAFLLGLKKDVDAFTD